MSENSADNLRPTQTTYVLPTSPLTPALGSSSGSRCLKTSSIFENLHNGKFKDQLLTANDAFAVKMTSAATTAPLVGPNSKRSSVVSGATLTNSQQKLQNIVKKTPRFWSPEVLSMECTSKGSHFVQTIEDFKLTGDETVLKSLETQSFKKHGKVQQMLRKAVKEYNKYLLLSKRQEAAENEGEETSDNKNRLNGEYIYMNLQIHEIRIVKYELISKISKYYHVNLIEAYKRFDDPYNTNGEKKKYEQELLEKFDQFYEFLLQIEYLEREENKMYYLLQNMKSMKISQDGYMRYYLNKLLFQT